MALKYQLGRIDQLQKENEMLMQRIKEFTIDESEEKAENPKPNRKTGSNGKKKKDENEFLIVDEEECVNTKDVVSL